MTKIVSSTAERDLREMFVGWQCRIRQMAMRNDGGKPSSGMMPRVSDQADRVLMERMVTLLVPLQPYESTEFFKHQVRRSNDRREILEKGLTYLQATHFQTGTGFRDELTAVFPQSSRISAEMVSAPLCVLEFAQFSQQFRLVCRVRELNDTSGPYQATLWHNRLFNPELPDGVSVLGFQPDWSVSTATSPG